jgi:hypothetical protein
MSAHTPLTIEIKEAYRGLLPSSWFWFVLTTRGGVRRILAEGQSQTGEGAIYAATMEARLYDPSFNNAALAKAVQP